MNAYMNDYKRELELEAMRSILEADGASRVYFAREDGFGAIKIGFTGGSLEHRISGLQVGSAHLIELCGEVAADRRLERYLKHRFAPARIRGEWFQPVEELIALVYMFEELDRTRRKYLDEKATERAEAYRRHQRATLFQNNPTKGLSKKLRESEESKK